MATDWSKELKVMQMTVIPRQNGERYFSALVKFSDGHQERYSVTANDDTFDMETWLRSVYLARQARLDLQDDLGS